LKPVLRLALPLVLIALSLAACNSEGDDEGEPADTPIEAEAPDVPGNADPADVQVIADWADTLRSGDVEGAADFFAIPSVAENGPIVLEIERRKQAVLFNASLPCGARLIRAEAEGEFVTATFRLTERPGPGTCGTGTGGKAKTAFVIEEEEIVEWRRVAIGGEQAPSQTI
jgi:hypothetical protein